jgi:hypothetical protein
MAITLQSHRTLQECKHQELEPLSEDDRSWKSIIEDSQMRKVAISLQH